MAKPASIPELKAAIVENLNGLDEEQLGMLYDIIEDLAPQAGQGSHWDDPEFVAEMDRRLADYEANPENMRAAADVHDAVLARLAEFNKRNIA